MTVRWREPKPMDWAAIHRKVRYRDKTETSGARKPSAMTSTISLSRARSSALSGLVQFVRIELSRDENFCSILAIKVRKFWERDVRFASCSL